MNSTADKSPGATTTAPPNATILSFLRRCFAVSHDGNIKFYTWMIFLTAVILVGVNAYVRQLSDGLVVSGMSDHVSWGIYISNFTYFVGLAAGAVMMVIPAYVYKNKAVHDVVVLGEILAIAAIIMAIAFVTVDLGHPERIWHMFPMMGVLNWPDSLLTWDVIVLSGYLLLNMYVVGYVLYCRFRGIRPKPRRYIPVVFISIFWAISIHTVTAFLYSGLGGRPFWNSAILAPRFITSAFVTGPAFLVLALHLVKRFTSFVVEEEATRTLVKIMRITVILNLFLLAAEVFTEFYTEGTHTDAAKYLYFGLHGHAELVPWIWLAIVLNVTAALGLVYTAKRPSTKILNAVCIMSLLGIWIEKGMGLIVPGFVPSAMHEMVPYTPSTVEWKVTLGIWALGLLVFTIGTKIAVAFMSGRAVATDVDQGPIPGGTNASG